MLQSLLPREVVKLYCVGDHGAPREGPLDVVGEIYSGAVVTCDLTGFTALTSQFQSGGDLGVEKLQSVLNSFFSLQISVLARYGGDVVGFLGDALLASFRACGNETRGASCERCASAAPGSDERCIQATRHAVVRAARCALELQNRIQSFSDPIAGVRLSVKVGIGAGRVMAFHGGIGEGLPHVRDQDAALPQHRALAYFLSGPAVLQIGQLKLQPGEIVMSDRAAALMEQCAVEGSEALAVRLQKHASGVGSAVLAAEPETSTLAGDAVLEPEQLARLTRAAGAAEDVDFERALNPGIEDHLLHYVPAPVRSLLGLRFIDQVALDMAEAMGHTPHGGPGSGRGPLHHGIASAQSAASFRSNSRRHRSGRGSALVPTSGGSHGYAAGGELAGRAARERAARERAALGAARQRQRAPRLHHDARAAEAAPTGSPSGGGAFAGLAPEGTPPGPHPRPLTERTPPAGEGGHRGSLALPGEPRARRKSAADSPASNPGGEFVRLRQRRRSLAGLPTAASASSDVDGHFHADIGGLPGALNNRRRQTRAAAAAAAALERTGSSALERTGSSALERTGSSALERAGSASPNFFYGDLETMSAGGGLGRRRAGSANAGPTRPVPTESTPPLLHPPLHAAQAAAPLPHAVEEPHADGLAAALLPSAPSKRGSPTEGPGPGPERGLAPPPDRDRRRMSLFSRRESAITAGRAVWLSEFRTVSAVFVKARTPRPARPAGAGARAMVAMLRAVNANSGVMRQFIQDDKGDLVMLAIFGLPPTSSEDDPLYAVKAAHDMLLALRAVGFGAPRFEARAAKPGADARAHRRRLRGGGDGPRLLLGHRLHRAALRVRSVSPRSPGPPALRFAARARTNERAARRLGAAVNLASRLMSRAEAGCLLCDGNTQGSVGERAPTEPAGELTLKGIPQPVRVHRLRTAGSPSLHGRGSPSSAPPSLDHDGLLLPGAASVREPPTQRRRGSVANDGRDAAIAAAAAAAAPPPPDLLPPSRRSSLHSDGGPKAGPGPGPPSPLHLPLPGSRRHSGASTRRSSAPAVARLVGRGAEREAFGEHLAALLEGRPPGMLVLEAEAGHGKSMLVQHFVGQAREATVQALLAKCSFFKSATPLHAWRAPLLHLLGLSEADCRTLLAPFPAHAPGGSMTPAFTRSRLTSRRPSEPESGDEEAVPPSASGAAASGALEPVRESPHGTQPRTPGSRETGEPSTPARPPAAVTAVRGQWTSASPPSPQRAPRADPPSLSSLLGRTSLSTVAPASIAAFSPSRSSPSHSLQRLAEATPAPGAAPGASGGGGGGIGSLTGQALQLAAAAAASGPGAASGSTPNGRRAPSSAAALLPRNGSSILLLRSALASLAASRAVLPSAPPPQAGGCRPSSGPLPPPEGAFDGPSSSSLPGAPAVAATADSPSPSLSPEPAVPPLVVVASPPPQRRVGSRSHSHDGSRAESPSGGGASGPRAVGSRSNSTGTTPPPRSFAAVAAPPRFGSLTQRAAALLRSFRGPRSGLPAADPAASSASGSHGATLAPAMALGHVGAPSEGERTPRRTARRMSEDHGAWAGAAPGGFAALGGVADLGAFFGRGPHAAPAGPAAGPRTPSSGRLLSAAASGRALAGWSGSGAEGSGRRRRRSGTGSGHGVSPLDEQFALLGTLLEGAAAIDGPLLLVFEDAHWADSASWAALGYLAAHPPQGVLIVVAMRPAPERPDAALIERVLDSAAVTCLELAPLQPAEIEQLVLAVMRVSGGPSSGGPGSEAGDDHHSEADPRSAPATGRGRRTSQDGNPNERVPPALVAFLAARTAGLPFFVTQMVGYLWEHGVVQLSPDGRRVELAQELGGEGVLAGLRSEAESVHRVICSRIDRLAPTAQTVLKVAAVCGMLFTEGMVRAVVPEELAGQDVTAALAALEEQGFIARREDEEGEAAFDAHSAVPELGEQGGLWAFRHTLVKEVAYSLTTHALRCLLHSRVAEYHVAIAGAAAPHALVASHFLDAGDAPRAVLHLELAGEQAWACSAAHETAHHFGKLLELAAQSQAVVPALRRARWSRLAGDAALFARQPERARRYYRRTLELLGDPLPEAGASGAARAARDAISVALGTALSCGPSGRARCRSPRSGTRRSGGCRGWRSRRAPPRARHRLARPRPRRPRPRAGLPRPVPRRPRLLLRRSGLRALAARFLRSAEAAAARAGDDADARRAAAAISALAAHEAASSADWGAAAAHAAAACSAASEAGDLHALAAALAARAQAALLTYASRADLEAAVDLARAADECAEASAPWTARGPSPGPASPRAPTPPPPSPSACTNDGPALLAARRAIDSRRLRACTPHAAMAAGLEAAGVVPAGPEEGHPGTGPPRCCCARVGRGLRRPLRVPAGDELWEADVPALVAEALEEVMAAPGAEHHHDASARSEAPPGSSSAADTSAGAASPADPPGTARGPRLCGPPPAPAPEPAPVAVVDVRRGSGGSPPGGSGSAVSSLSLSGRAAGPAPRPPPSPTPPAPPPPRAPRRRRPGAPARPSRAESRRRPSAGGLAPRSPRPPGFTAALVRSEAGVLDPRAPRATPRPRPRPPPSRPATPPAPSRTAPTRRMGPPGRHRHHRRPAGPASGPPTPERKPAAPPHSPDAARAAALLSRLAAAAARRLKRHKSLEPLGELLRARAALAAAELAPRHAAASAAAQAAQAAAALRRAARGRSGGACLRRRRSAGASFYLSHYRLEAPHG
eukprot:tig00000310_g23949.t1